MSYGRLVGFADAMLRMTVRRREFVGSDGIDRIRSMIPCSCGLGMRGSIA